jgi:hypothetical protein
MAALPRRGESGLSPSHLIRLRLHILLQDHRCNHRFNTEYITGSGAIPYVRHSSFWRLDHFFPLAYPPGADQNAAEAYPLRLGSNVAFQHDLNRDTPGSQWRRRNGFEAWR